MDTLNEEFTLFIENNLLTAGVLKLVTGLMSGLNALFGTFEGKLRGLNEIELEEQLAGINKQIEIQTKNLKAMEFSLEDTFRIEQKIANLEAKALIIKEKLNKNDESKARIEKRNNEILKEKSKLTKLQEDLSAKALLASEREIEDLGKTEVELRKLAMTRKIEDALLSKKIKDIINK